MNMTDLLLNILPTVIILVAGVLMVRKSGVFEQKRHRERVEELLERIAQAVEKSTKSSNQ